MSSKTIVVGVVFLLFLTACGPAPVEPEPVIVPWEEPASDLEPVDPVVEEEIEIEDPEPTLESDEPEETEKEEPVLFSGGGRARGGSGGSSQPTPEPTPEPAIEDSNTPEALQGVLGTGQESKVPPPVIPQ
jgi:hypothetical protein